MSTQAVMRIVEVERDHEACILARALQLYDRDLKIRITAMQQRRQELLNGRTPEAHEPDADGLLLVIQTLQERGRRLEAMTKRILPATPDQDKEQAG